MNATPVAASAAPPTSAAPASGNAARTASPVATVRAAAHKASTAKTATKGTKTTKASAQKKPAKTGAKTGGTGTAAKRQTRAALPPLPPGRFGDRELSWLNFNQRVLELAEDHHLPLLERVRFCSIFSSNLDEFFMVRVAGLKRRIDAGMAVTGPSGMAPRHVLGEIARRAHELTARQARLFVKDIKPALAAERINIVEWDDLDPSEHERLGKYFRKHIFPVLTPLAVDPSHPFPYISGLSLNLALIVRDPATGKSRFARVKVPEMLPRFIAVDQKGKPRQPAAANLHKGTTSFVPIEAVIAHFLEYLFPGTVIDEYSTFRVTRNEDIEVEEDDAENLLKAMEKELLRRRFGPPIRLEVAKDMPSNVLKLLLKELHMHSQEVYELPEPLDYRGLDVIADLDRPDLCYPPFVPTTHPQLAEVESAMPRDIFAAIRTRDVLLHHPYDSFSTSVQQLLAQAAADPKVLAIKQTLYRTSGDSPIIDSLIDAAHAGKQVLALVELKARFDEEANITWARKLEQAGVHVVYGLVGLKTHCKLMLVVRQETQGLQHYCHVGTGNYNPKTARQYEDLGLLTCDPAVCQDVARLFNQLSGYAPNSSFDRLVVAPTSIRTGLLSRIEREIANRRAGLDAWIKIKVNSVVDETTIDALYRASQAGVPVDLVVRGICALRPGIPGLSENIRVRSILGRFLEHARVYAFANAGGEQPDILIGSADLMHRNLDRRVEALVSITDPAHIIELLDMLNLSLDPGTATWHQLPDGTYEPHRFGPDGEPLRDIQEAYMDRQHRRGHRVGGSGPYQPAAGSPMSELGGRWSVPLDGSERVPGGMAAAEFGTGGSSPDGSPMPALSLDDAGALSGGPGPSSAGSARGWTGGSARSGSGETASAASVPAAPTAPAKN
jgi:polyphosphate kinase